MKKRIALLLAAVMLLSLTACGGSAAPEETVPPTAVATEPTETEPVETEPASPFSAQSEIDMALQEAKAPVLSWPSNDVYNVVLRGLGYKELDFTKYVIVDEQGYYDMERNIGSKPIQPATIHNIQFLDDMVRVEFSWYEPGDAYEEDGWVLYCTKADGIADISGIDAEYYDGCHPFNFSDAFEDWRTGFVERWDYQYVHPSRMAVVQAYYYPESGNLYNLVKTYDYFPETGYAPRVLCRNAEEAEDYLLGSEIALTFVDDYPIGTSEFAIICDDEAESYKYRIGMSLAAWAASELNTGGWTLGPDNMLISPDRQYWLECTDWDMEDVGYEEFTGDSKFFVGIRTRAEQKRAAEKIADTNTVAVYLENWQTPLLSTGFAVVGENYTENRITYGMYDVGYGCESGEVFRIYMRNVHPSLLADVKVYAVPDNGEKTIPENAVCFAFENVEALSAGDARFGITMAEAVYDMAADPNITPEGDFAFAITCQDKLVYWIHMPAVTAAQ